MQLNIAKPMEEYQISCIVRDTNGVITNIGIEGKVYSVSHAAQLIVDKKCRFYIVTKDGNKEFVEQRKDPTTKQIILTTNLENNLDSLPSC
ncbi:MAG: hypothetical protein AB7U98_00215 [Candidatus Nitrosocosmicus sp.]